MRQEFDTPTLETIYLVQTTAFTFGGLWGPVPRRPLVRAVEGKNEERLADELDRRSPLQGRSRAPNGCLSC